MDKTISSIEQLELLMSQAPCGVDLFEIDTRHPIYFNDEYYKISGYTKEEYKNIRENKAETLLFQEDMDIGKNKADFC